MASSPSPPLALPPDAESLHPPVAQRRPHTVRIGAVAGENRGPAPIDPPLEKEDALFWLRDDARTSGEVLDVLRAENAYSDGMSAHLADLRETLYNEHVGHLKEDDHSAPVPHGPWMYYTRTVKAQSYELHCRVPGSNVAAADFGAEQVLLDVNALADGHDHCTVRKVAPAPGHEQLAFSVDFTGNEMYTVRFRDVATGKDRDEVLEGTSGSVVWGRDASDVFYLVRDAQHRPYKVFRHVLGTPQDADTCLATEDDATFNMTAFKSMDGRVLFMGSISSEASEWRMLDLTTPGAEPVVIQPRIKTPGVLYWVEHHSGTLFVLHNKDGAVNNKLSVTAVASPGVDHWVDIVPHNTDVHLADMSVFKSHVALEGRSNGLTQVWTFPLPTHGESGAAGAGAGAGGTSSASSCGEVGDALAAAPPTPAQVPFDDELYECGISANRVWDTTSLRVYYSSLRQPSTWLDIDMTSLARTVVKTKAVLDYDPDTMACRRVWAKANDGTRIPVSIVHRADLYSSADGVAVPKPTLLYGYGSYGICIDPGFNQRVLPLLNRGVVFAIAHVRGGGEMGRAWYEVHGKYRTKGNTFSDFINCAEHLIATGVTAPSMLAAEGRSAGGLLMGAITNMRPDLWRVVVAGVPFVDVVTTMCDASIPLTTGEWLEWGNPNEWQHYDAIRAYSPTDNVRRLPYPTVIATAGLHDTRVGYWEPLKWVQLLREHSTSRQPVLARFDIAAGHFSASSRYKYLRERAWEQALLLAWLGATTKLES